MARQFTKIEVKNRIARVTYHKPPVNATNGEAYRELTEVFGELSARDDISAVLFCSEGKGFMGGNDVAEIKGHTKAAHPQYQKLISDCMTSVIQCRHPVICAVQGYAIGAGLVFAASSDIVVASDDAWFNLPEITLGIVAGASFAMTVLPEKIVKYLCFTGNRLTAQEMLQYGAVNFVTPRDRLMDKAEEIAARIAEMPPATLTYFKEVIGLFYNHQCDQKFQLETAYTGRVLETPEKEEAVNAFFEKRKPNYF